MSLATQELRVTIFGRDMASAEFNKVTESAKTSASSMKDLGETSNVELGKLTNGAEESARSMKELGSVSAGELTRVGESAAASAVSMKELSRDVVALGMSASAVGRLGEMFGLLNAEQARVLTDMGSMVALAATVGRGLELLAAKSWAVTIAEKARAIAHAVAWALSGPAGWAILAAAAATAAVAIGWAASQIRDAADAQRDFNAAVAEMPAYPSRNIERAGEEGMFRRGVE